MIKKCLNCNQKFKFKMGNYKFCFNCRPFIIKLRGQLHSKIYRTVYIEQRRKDRKKYNDNHKIERNRNNKLRRKTDLLFRLIANLRNNLHNALKYNKKISHTKELIGCSIEFLKSHLEKQFKSGMTWKNYGKGKIKWCIDHIRPCSSFDLTDIEQQKQCFHYSNLQPLWFIENIKKGDKIC